MKRILQTLFLAGSIVMARAQGEAIQDFATGSTGPFNATAGWAFTTTDVLTVSSLGCLANLINVYGAVNVGLWDNNGVALATVSVATTNDLYNASRYVSIQPLILAAAQTYRVGVYSPSAMYLTYLDSPPLPGEYVTTGLGIGTVKNALAVSGFTFPSGTGPDGTIVFGANFRYTPSIPEPATGLLFVTGLIFIATRARR